MTEASALRERFVLGANISKRVAAAAASAVMQIIFYFYLNKVRKFLSLEKFLFSVRGCCCGWRKWYQIFRGDSSTLCKWCFDTSASNWFTFYLSREICPSWVIFFSTFQYFSNNISRILLPVDGVHGACCEEMGASISRIEAAAQKGLLQCIDTVMAEVGCISVLLIS